MFVEKFHHFEVLGFVSERHKHVVGKKSLPILVDIDLIKLVSDRRYVCGDDKPIVFFFRSIKKRYIGVESLMNDSIRLRVVDKLDSVLLVPFLRVEIKFRVYFLFDQLLYLAVDVLWKLLVLVLQF